jgi:hypothetical protein
MAAALQMRSGRVNFGAVMVWLRGNLPLLKTIGSVVVSALAALVEAEPPTATITATSTWLFCSFHGLGSTSL